MKLRDFIPAIDFKCHMPITLVFLFGVVAISITACAGASSDYPDAKWSYKMTVAIETPEGIKTGSAVREISMVSRPMFMGENNDTHVKFIRGTAVAIDLDNRGWLFAPLDDSPWAFFRTFRTPCLEGPVSRCGVKYYASLKEGEKAQVPTNGYPNFIKFRDTHDPTSVEYVQKMKSCHAPGAGYEPCIGESRFEEVLGAGVKLKEITIEVTNESPSSSLLEKLLPWMPQYYDKRLDGQRYGMIKSPYPAANTLSSGSFVAGMGLSPYE